MGKHASHTLTWQDFESRLPDGDMIHLTETATGLANLLRVGLQTPHWITWRKELQEIRTTRCYYSPSSKYTSDSGSTKRVVSVSESTTMVDSVATQDAAHGPFMFDIDVSQGSTVYLVLCKAKTLGLLTPVYELPIGELAKKAGRQVLFLWEID